MSAFKTDSEQLPVCLKRIAKIPCINQEKIYHYARQVEQMMRLLDLKSKLQQQLEHPLALSQWAQHAQLSEKALTSLLDAGVRARSRLIETHLSVVVPIAKRYRGQGLDLSELIQIGTMGLSRAVEKFDPSKGSQLSSYSHWWIDAKIREAIKHRKKENKFLHNRPAYVLDRVESRELQPEEIGNRSRGCIEELRK